MASLHQLSFKFTYCEHPRNRRARNRLSGTALKVWIELRSRFNGRNNGELSLSLDEGARLLGMGKTTVGRAFYHAIDVAAYARKGLLEPGTTGWTRWSRGGEETGSICFRADHGCIVLIYRTRSHGGEWEDVEQRISLTHTTPHFGGARPWFVCPNCSRRCGKLYGGTRFYCRKCWGLVYESQRENRAHRLLNRAQKIRMRLDGSPSVDDAFPSKPKGMHWRTYERLWRKHDALVGEMNGALMEWIGCKLGRYLE